MFSCSFVLMTIIRRCSNSARLLTALVGTNTDVQLIKLEQMPEQVAFRVCDLTYVAL